jgi:hypothetical protein
MYLHTYPPSSSSSSTFCAIACQRESTTDNSRAVVYLFISFFVDGDLLFIPGKTRNPESPESSSLFV